MKVVILCGGQGTRLREETEFKPKPMVTIGSMPILYHIMKRYASYGFDEFVLCLGYKGEQIKDYFLNYQFMNNDFTMNLNQRKNEIVHKNARADNWSITFADTGLNACTGARVKKIEKYLDGSEDFFVTYGDGLSDVNIDALLKFHKKQGTIATLTAAHPHSRWGRIRENEEGKIVEFVEKPVLFDYINGGFFVFKQALFDYLSEEDGCVLESEPFEKLVSAGQFSCYKHDGFWHAMDTFKDALELNRIWNSGNVPWQVD
ncbi:MAG: glucose-1-phosphate cytidylyltransferase [Candidatus Micrarchaeia archaeon]